MSTEEVQNEINDLKKAVDSLKKEFGRDVASLKKSFEKDMSALEAKMEDMKVQSRDTYIKAQEAKHEAGNVKGNLANFIALFEKNQEQITEALASRKSDSEKVVRILNWLDEFSKLATYEGWKNLFMENSANTKHREMQLSWKQLFVNISVICGAIVVAIGVAKLIGLFK